MTGKKLSNLFSGIAAKRLAEVDTNPDKSNQHEITGTTELRELLGESTEKVRLKTRVLYLDDDVEDRLSEEIISTWYDTRFNQKHRSAEYRLYYPTSRVMEAANAGDLIIIGKMTDDTLLMVIAAAGSTVENQLLWLFDINESLLGNQYALKLSDQDQIEIGYARRFILEEIGIEPYEEDLNLLDELLLAFGNRFPTTKTFSQYARTAIAKEIDPIEAPDDSLISLIEHEEMLFRTFERHLLQKKLAEGFDDTDDFIQYSLSIQNRRKSRAGHALEHHLAYIFDMNQIQFDRGKPTENKSKPDFVFPSIDAYHNSAFPVAKLSMLGAKSTCKDRWRQVLSEADRISDKHLLTLEPGISENQTHEMQAHQLSLVVPEPLMATYTQNQQSWLIDLGSFIKIVIERQEA